MRSHFLRAGLLSALALFTFTACDYEWKDEPPEVEEEVPADDEEAPEEDAPAKPAERREPKSDARPVLAPGKPYAGSSTLPAGSKKIDILNLQALNQATIETNVPGNNDANLMFDGNDETLLRSPEVNPVDATITFTNPQKIKAIRVRSTYSDFAVAVQIDGGDRLILDPVPEGDWALMVWPTQIEAKKVFVQVLRKIRDNYVHVNEIEMYP